MHCNKICALVVQMSRLGSGGVAHREVREPALYLAGAPSERLAFATRRVHRAGLFNRHQRGGISVGGNGEGRELSGLEFDELAEG